MLFAAAAAHGDSLKSTAFTGSTSTPTQVGEYSSPIPYETRSPLKTGRGESLANSVQWSPRLSSLIDPSMGGPTAYPWAQAGQLSNADIQEVYSLMKAQQGHPVPTGLVEVRGKPGGGNGNNKGPYQQ